MPGITVIKRNPAGMETWRYSGELLWREGNVVFLQALFNRDDMSFMGIMLKRGDCFKETFYLDRWYNIFEIRDRDNDTLKGWYCNIGKPAVLEADDRISYVDLALDLWVAADGRQTVLDEDEFVELDLDAETRKNALLALEELKLRFLSVRDS
jgi:hypothetical protein